MQLTNNEAQNESRRVQPDKLIPNKLLVSGHKQQASGNRPSCTLSSGEGVPAGRGWIRTHEGLKPLA